jgi:hypothetical protein
VTTERSDVGPDAGPLAVPESGPDAWPVAEAGASAAPRRTAGRVLLLGLLALAVAAQVVVLYAPSSPADPRFAGADKVVHVLVFLVPVTVALLAGGPLRLVVGVFAAHAVVSEVVQGVALTARSGDALDTVADLVGIGLGVLVWALVGRVAARRRPSAAGG